MESKYIEYKLLLIKLILNKFLFFKLSNEFKLGNF